MVPIRVMASRSIQVLDRAKKSASHSRAWRPCPLAVPRLSADAVYAGSGSGLTRTALSTPIISNAMPASVNGCGMLPRRMKA